MIRLNHLFKFEASSKLCLYVLKFISILKINISFFAARLLQYYLGLLLIINLDIFTDAFRIYKFGIQMYFQYMLFIFIYHLIYPYIYSFNEYIKVSLHWTIVQLKIHIRRIRRWPKYKNSYSYHWTLTISTGLWGRRTPLENACLNFRYWLLFYNPIIGGYYLLAIYIMLVFILCICIL